MGDGGSGEDSSEKQARLRLARFVKPLEHPLYRLDDVRLHLRRREGSQTPPYHLADKGAQVGVGWQRATARLPDGRLVDQEVP